MMRKSYEIIKKHPINHYTLRRALDGKNVSRTFGENLSLIVGVPFDKLFTIEEKYENISYNTKKKYTAFLSKMLSQAVKDGYIAENYSLSKFINGFKDNTPNKDLKCMKFEEFHIYNKKMLEPYPNFPELIANLILAETGMRKEELCGLKWNAIDMENQFITIKTTVTYINNIGIVINEYKTKNKSSFRTISISNYLITKLKEYKEYQLEQINFEKNIKVDTSKDD